MESVIKTSFRKSGFLIRTPYINEKTVKKEYPIFIFGMLPEETTDEDLVSYYELLKMDELNTDYPLYMFKE